MSNATLLSAGLLGIEAYPIHVEVDITKGLPGWSTVGLPESAVRESKERVISSIHNCGYEFPFRRITLNLAPAGVKKQGTGFDLPIAVGLLTASEKLPKTRLGDYLLLGELSLQGQLRPVRGALSVARLAQRQGLKGLILPLENASEAAMIGGLEVWGARDLPEVVEFLCGRIQLQAPSELPPTPLSAVAAPDFSEVQGQAHAKRAMEVAAAGFHNLMMVGPPGTGKSLMAGCLPSILPPMSLEESLTTMQIYSLVGQLQEPGRLMKQRPFRAPHHTISDAGLIGGGSFPRPGEVSLAHNGVLFLDEIPEFKRNALESLRQPLESHQVILSRAQCQIMYPSRFLLVGAMNPCPCGQRGNPRSTCLCPVGTVQRYQGRISGPLLDRFDLKVEVPALSYSDLQKNSPEEASATILERVLAARERQQSRFRGTALLYNAQMRGREIREFCRLDAEGEALLEAAVQKWALSARAYHRILKVTRTLADLDGDENISLAHLSEAIAYRTGQSKGQL
ncbi:MAG TPA: ATP-dependent protease [Deltaproteobacteria bacterium]|nr:ATP-dependent protease [Deltaproteobacteria bacterium]